MTDQRSRDGVAAILDVQAARIRQLETDCVVLEDALKATGGKRPATPQPLALTPIGALLAEPDDAVEWLVEDRFAYGSINLLAGKPKAGKSTLARYLAFCIATGTPFLGHPTTEGLVWYLVLEDKRSEVRRHFRLLGATGAESIRFLFGNATDLLAKVRLLALREKPAAIVVDTLQRLIGAKDLNDYSEVTTKLTPVMELARETGAVLVLVHHAGKGDRAGIDQVLGSTALAGSVDNVFMVNRTERYRLLSSIQRIGSDLDETVLVLGSDGHVQAGSSRHDADVIHLQAALLAALENASNPLTRAEWLDAVEGRRQLKLEALRRLTTGPGTTIVRTGAGTRYEPYRYAAGSEVPSSRWEPPTREPSISTSSNESADLSGSQVPRSSAGGSRDAGRL